nr:uncharacterized protein LOC109407121 [Aedes albopictus]
MLIQAQSMMAETEPSDRNRRQRRPNIDRSAEEGAQRLIADYFADNPTYSSAQFRRRFRMSRELFRRIVMDVETANIYFVQRADATGKRGLIALQKCTAAMRQLAYGAPADAVDEYLRLSESTARNCLLEFCRTIVNVYEKEYLRSPNEGDLARLMNEGRKRGFPGMLGSLDCCHWEWKNCPTAWAGQYKGKGKKPTIVLEAVASHDLWIWHAFFGMPGSANDINVLERSPLFSDVYCGRTPPVQFEVNGTTYTTGYYLADGIYPPLSTLVQTIPTPFGQKRKHFAKLQEAARKDVERAFGVLMARFAILKNPARLWRREDLATIMRCCIILHNMIIEHQRDASTEPEKDFWVNDGPLNMGFEGGNFSGFLERYEKVHNATTHNQLQQDLIEHLWTMKGEME